MSSTHEIVTIQAGYFSNFIGTHWWNMQESSFCYSLDNSAALDINHDVLFREGQNLQKDVTYTPRLVLIDLKSNMRSIRRESPLYRILNENSEVLWDGKVDVVKEKPVRKNPYLEESEASVKSKELAISEASQKFDSDTSWSDYLKTNLHPKSFCLLPETAPSDSGEEIYEKSGRDISEESIRKMTEECDNLQGFNVILDAHNGFAAISHRILQHLNDEYGRSSLCFPVFQDYKATPVLDLRQQMHRLFAIISSLSSMNAFSSCFSPLCLCDSVIQQAGPYRIFPFLQYKEDCLYHTSAIYASAIEMLTSQCRLKSRKFDLCDVTSAMSVYGRKLACSSIVLPFNLSEGSFLSSVAEMSIPEYFPISLSPFYNPSGERTLCQSAILRGVTKDKFQRPSNFLHHLPEVEEVFGEYLKKYSPSSVATATIFSERLSTADPFPNLFREGSSLPHSKGLEKVSAFACLSSSNAAGTFIGDLLAQISVRPFQDYIKSAKASFDRDEFQELLQGLIGLQDNYQEG